tara:strand:- start:440 stop:871 length:432 start_codon:yes stop_codon:yes gene_type:complete
MDRLPIEIQNKIWNLYWHYKFNKVVNEISFVSNRDVSIHNFMLRFALSIYNSYYQNYIYHITEINHDILYICNNPGLKLLCKINNLYLKNINISKANYICKGVNDNFKYACYYVLLVLRFNKIATLEYFRKLKYNGVHRIRTI